MLLIPEEKRAGLRRAFVAETGSELCTELKLNRYPCADCVKLAAELAEEA